MKNIKLTKITLTQQATTSLIGYHKQVMVFTHYPLLSRKVNGKSEVFGVNKWSKYPVLPPTNPDIIVEGVLDVAVCSKGKLVYGFEIVHKQNVVLKNFISKISPHNIRNTCMKLVPAGY